MLNTISCLSFLPGTTFKILNDLASRQCTPQKWPLWLLMLLYQPSTLILFNLSTAFDTVNCKTLLSILMSLGISDPTWLAWRDGHIRWHVQTFKWCPTRLSAWPNHPLSVKQFPLRDLPLLCWWHQTHPILFPFRHSCFNLDFRLPVGHVMDGSLSPENQFQVYIPGDASSYQDLVR